MRRIHAVHAVALAAVMAVGGVAGCGGGDDPGSVAAGTTSTAATSPAAPTVTGPRSFGYVNNGLEATLDIDGSAGTLTIVNGRDEEVATPALHLLDGVTGARSDAELTGAAPIPAGATVRLAFRFPATADSAAAG
ncbi:MAG: hypothetical protein AB1416_11670, partial [Actinomycetota bacterium]